MGLEWGGEEPPTPHSLPRFRVSDAALSWECGKHPFLTRLTAVGQASSDFQPGLKLGS